MHACDLGAAFLSWASVLSRPPKTAAVSHRTNSDVRQSRRTTLRLLEALRLVVLHEPLSHAHHALRRWHELAQVGRSPRAALHERNDRAWPPKARLAPATRHRRSPPLGTEEREAIVSVTSDDLHALMETVADLQDQLVRGDACPAQRAPLWLLTRARRAWCGRDDESARWKPPRAHGPAARRCKPAATSCTLGTTR